jgi:hypothetical protein
MSNKHVAKLMQNHRQKRFKSSENKVVHELTLNKDPKPIRKYTFDLTGESS